MNIELGGWINNEKILVLITGIINIPFQKYKFVKVIDAPCVEVSPEKIHKVVYQNALIYLQSLVGEVNPLCG